MVEHDEMVKPMLGIARTLPDGTNEQRYFYLGMPQRQRDWIVSSIEESDPDVVLEIIDFNSSRRDGVVTEVKLTRLSRG